MRNAMRLIRDSRRSYGWLFRVARYDSAKAPINTVAPTNGNKRYPAPAITAPPTEVPIAWPK